MKHVGDITMLYGGGLPPVDCITGGSPCQDLSVAGVRAGLAGSRSGLFMEQVRIIREMREKSGAIKPFPRYAVWENVPGAFSSNGGRDFQRVLTEFVRIADPSAPDVPMPEKGKWTKAGALMGDGWSLAWRTLDAQFWGVPQRRRRIAVVCDFGGGTAPEILFERKGVSGNFKAGGAERQKVAGAVKDCPYPAVARTLMAESDGSFDIEGRGGNIIVQSNVKCLTPWEPQSGRIYDESGVFHTLYSGGSAGMQRDAVLAAGFNAHEGSKAHGLAWQVECAPTLSLTQMAVFDARGNGDGKTVCTLTGDHENRITDYTAQNQRTVWPGCEIGEPV